MQVHPIKPMLKPPGTNLLTQKYDAPLSFFAFNFNLRRYTKARAAHEAREALVAQEGDDGEDGEDGGESPGRPARSILKKSKLPGAAEQGSY